MNETPSPAQAPFAAPAPEAATSPPPSLEIQLTELQASLGEASDAYLRAKAEAENTRRRAEEEVSKARKYAVDAFAESLLPVMDSLQAAIAQPDAEIGRASCRERV